MIILFLFLQILWADEDLRPLKVESIEYSDVGGGPSCSLLQHRKLEREKIIREYIHLRGDSEDLNPNAVMKIHNFMTHQYFLEGSIDSDESIQAHVLVNLDPEDLLQIEAQGLPETTFHIQSPGLTWASKAFQFPKETTWTLLPERRQLEIHFLIYKADHCFDTTETQISVAHTVAHTVTPSLPPWL